MRDLNLFKWLKIAINDAVICTGNCAIGFTSALCAMSTTGYAYAQITSDTTLPINSNIQKIGNTIKIEGGTTAGSNLFHSFSEFSVPTGSTADFNNSLNIQNIISRVTGKSISNIDGLIRANGTANLFLINPNGIIFGQNARLDIGGSFVASTASSLKFANGFEFSATNPQSAPLLSINVPIGLQYGANPGAIQVKGDGQGLRLTDELIDTTDALRVPANQTLALVGGDIFLEGATLKTAGGRIELGSVGDNSLVSLTPITKGFSLSYDGVQNFGNIQLSQLSAVDASGAGGGDIQVQGRRVTLSDGSEIEASTLGAGKGGNLVVNAQQLVELVGISVDGQFPSTLFINAQSTGDAGNLTINTQDLLVKDGAQVGAGTFGAGKGGSLTVTAQDVQLIGISADGSSASGLYTEAESTSTGDAGNLTINTQHLLVQDGAGVGAGTFGAGKGGSLTVTAQDVQVIGISADGSSVSGLFNQARSTGDAGKLTINTQHLLVQDAGQVSADTFGAGKGGSLTVTAPDVQLIGTSADGQINSGLFADAVSTGNAGNLTINTQHLLVQGGAQAAAGTFGAGKGGSLTVTAQDVQVIGTSADGRFGSGLYTQADATSIGDAGNLTINTQHLLVRDGAEVSANTLGAGKGGFLTVTAPDVQLIGTSADGKYLSRLFTVAYSTGDAGNLTINTQHLLVRDGAEAAAGTFGAGKGGSLNVTAQDVQLIGTSADSSFSSGLFASTQSTGDAGNLTINTDKLLVQDRAIVTVRSQGSGIAGNLTINAGSIRLNNNAALNANTQAVNTDPNIEQATINLRSKDLILLRGSNITTNANGENVIGGNINIDTDVLVAFANSDISANSTDFRGGNVKINATGIFGTQSRDAPTLDSDITATGKNQQLNGTVQVNTVLNPNNGLVQLPTDFVDRSGLIAQGCPANKGNSFTITGRGGLPPLPTQALRTNQTATVNWVTLNSQEQRNTSVGENSHLGKSKSPKLEVPQISPTIVEATGWVINKSGTVELTAFAPIPTYTNTFNSAIASTGDLPIVACPSQAAAIQK
ncbi:MAG: S-layer family protein [Nostoc sp. NMS7]|uniref:S-layer family protein n=1 Tax=Nostoc sp. NMS7 TaxID=2815391 RepID=UPI0025F4C454|nr:S-layer family protein [Nostoc sp. NMS7]MBN3948987.1 S-layer family protein [Nostoc sp. NMS7]